MGVQGIIFISLGEYNSSTLKTSSVIDYLGCRGAHKRIRVHSNTNEGWHAHQDVVMERVPDRLSR